MGFTKGTGIGFESFEEFKKMFGAAGTGKAWHHIVEQNADNIAKFGSKNIHHTDNVVPLLDGEGQIHKRINGYMSRKNSQFGGITPREFLKDKSFEFQYDYGLKVLNAAEKLQDGEKLLNVKL